MKTMKLTLLLLLALPGIALSKSETEAQKASAGVAFVEPPAQLKAAIDDAARRGRTIWELDKASSLASDRLGAWLALDPRLAGAWITMREGNVFTTVWPGMIDGNRVGLYSASLDIDRATQAQNVPQNASADLLPAPFPLTDEQARRLTAINAAAAAPFEHLARTYNPVVMPSENGLTVYLLPGNTNPDVYPVGGVVRVDLGTDGAVTTVRPLSKTIIEMPRPGTGGVPGDLEAYFPMVTELGDHPTESHVFTSLNHSIRLIVVCPETHWLVQGEQIMMLRLPEK